MTQLLSDLVYFVTEHDTGREDVLNISVQNPNRDRQKLMREQYILKEVSLIDRLFLLSIFTNVGKIRGWDDAAFRLGQETRQILFINFTRPRRASRSKFRLRRQDVSRLALYHRRIPNCMFSTSSIYCNS